MHITFKDRTLQRLCLEQRVAQKELGKPAARRLRARLADLYAAANPTELMAGHPHPLKGGRHGQFSISLHGGMRLCFEPAAKAPAKPDGGIDWAAVESIRIVEIGDYHD